MALKDFFAKLLLKEETIDKKIEQAFRGSGLLQAGNVLEIQDKADEYIKYGYQGNADVYSIIRRYITMSTQARLTLQQKQADGTSIEITNHELSDYLYMANPNESMDELREAYTIFLLSTGNAFWYTPITTTGANKGKASQVYTLPANDMEIKSASHTLLTPDVTYHLEGSQIPFSTDEVYHSKYFNPFFFTTPTLYGQSPLQAAALIVSKQNQSERTQANQFENQGPAYMMFRDGEDSWNTMSEPQKIELQKEINGLSKKNKQGAGIVLKDKFNVIKLGISASDLNLLESSREGRRILCNVYGMPSVLFNDNENSSYNNMIEAKKDAWTNGLIPHNNKFANDLTQMLIFKNEEYKKAGYYFSFDYSNISELQDNMTEKVAWMKAARLTTNEIRQEAGFNEIDDSIMNEPIFNQGDILASEMMFDPTLTEPIKNLGDYK